MALTMFLQKESQLPSLKNKLNALSQKDAKTEVWVSTVRIDQIVQVSSKIYVLDEVSTRWHRRTTRSPALPFSKPYQISDECFPWFALEN